VDEQPISITATLEAAIRDLRDESRVLRIWADALCINQSDIDERNQQVSMMGQIYSTAHHTVIHLIPTSSAATRVLKAVLGNGQVENGMYILRISLEHWHRIVDTSYNFVIFSA